jgi:hypothetical protein
MVSSPTLRLKRLISIFAERFIFLGPRVQRVLGPEQEALAPCFHLG